MDHRAGQLARLAVDRMEAELPWFSSLPARERSMVALVAEAGVRSFLDWLGDQHILPSVTTDVFGAAPRELTRAISLRQTLDLVRTVVTVVDQNAATLAADPTDTEQVSQLSHAVLRYSREVAFSAAEVYAQAAELRGSWDARLEALVVDALLRGEPDDALGSRLAALGWRRHPNLAVIAGRSGLPAGSAHVAAEALRAAARKAADEALVGVHGERLVAVIGTSSDPRLVAESLATCFGPGPVILGPTVARLADIERSAQAALSGLAAAKAWPQAPRPAAAHDLLPERALAGDRAARAELVAEISTSIAGAGSGLEETVTSYLEQGRSLEATARALFVHANTVRYRLRRVADLTGWDVTRPRDAFVVELAIAYGRLDL